MNKIVDIRKNAIILFIINLIILISSIFLCILYYKQGYPKVLVNVNLVINIIILIIGIIFNILFIKESKKFDNKKYTIIIIILFIIVILFNFLFMSLMNHKLNKEYQKISGKLVSYCDSYQCDKYQTIKTNGLEEFVLEKTYFDFDNNQNTIKITTTYNTKEVLSVKAVIYSQSSMFSESIIKNELDDYLSNFGFEIDEEKIKEAFEKRFGKGIKDGNKKYEVKEIYEDNTLVKIKTTITLNLK